MLIWMEYPTNKPQHTGRYLCSNVKPHIPAFFIRYWNQDIGDWEPTVIDEDIDYWAIVNTDKIKALGDSYDLFN